MLIILFASLGLGHDLNFVNAMTTIPYRVVRLISSGAVDRRGCG